MAIEKEYTLKLTTKQAQENVDELNKSLEAQADLIGDIEKEIIDYEKQEIGFSSTLKLTGFEQIRSLGLL